MSDDRPARYFDEEAGVVVYRASSLGGCERMLVASAMPDVYPPSPWPDWFQEVLDEGTNAESNIDFHWTAESGIETVDQQMVVELEVGENPAGQLVVVRGHIDGRARVAAVDGGPGHDWVGREFKKFRESMWGKFLRAGVETLPNYPWQVSAMMLATGWDWEFVGGKLVDGVIRDVHAISIEVPPINFRAIHKKVMGVEKFIAEGFDPKEVECRVTYPCPYFKIHDPEQEPYEIPTSGEAAMKARDAIARLAEVQAYSRALEANLAEWKELNKQASADLRAALEELGDDAVAAKVLLTEEFRVGRVRKEIREHVRKASTQDYFSAKQVEGNER